MIDERPPEVEQRSRIGDWEGDTIIGKSHQGAAVTLVERVTKYTLIEPIEAKTAQGVEEAILRMFEKCPLPVKTITFDNGTAFANHQQIAQKTRAAVYFAHPYHSWERGLNENTNGLIRQYIPQNQNIKELSKQDCNNVQDKLNNRPRKALGFLSPIEFFHESCAHPRLFHLNLESALGCTHTGCLVTSKTQKVFTK
jgi:transposase, IS30 family